MQAKSLNELEYEALKSTVDNQITALDQAFVPDGIDFYAPLAYEAKAESVFSTVLSYLPPDALLVVDDWMLMVNNIEGYTDRLTRQLEEGTAKGRILDIGMPFHLNASECLRTLRGKMKKWLYLDTFPFADGMDDSGFELGESRFSFDVEAPTSFKADMKKAVDQFAEYRRKGFLIVVTSDSPSGCSTTAEWDVPAQFIGDAGISAEGLQQVASDVLVVRHGVVEGFLLPNEKIVHYTDAELFARRQKKIALTQTSAHKRQDADALKAIDELREGDYVVHIKHGIGRFMKTARIEIGHETREYLTIVYANNDKLHVPADQINMLARYRGAGDTPPKLNKMGGIDWSKTKSKAQKSVRNIARELLRLYAARSRTRGFGFEPDTPWQVEMEEAFPYVETPDQYQAIIDVKQDMESDKPMDRLICGDVGFGKTEVAIRAIFKAVLSGRQVAVLVPTTILAQQHFHVISERFKPYPIRVGLLSRFRTPKEQKEVVERLQMGDCDVVVGTHRLLQKDVRFKNLGLAIIDEEHRFGVSHKEKLKELRCEVDALTLSATPIPRTLYMSMSGVRDMTLINTPPVNRSPVKTFVGPYNPAQTRMAILQEVDRGGQVYFVHNRVQTIYERTNQLQELIPEVRFIIGHGQMNERDLENVMLEFSEQSVDVLVCTTIIESGVDIPTANTMIIDRADRFGLAQLYQLRGRVGRSDRQAYCYCYYDQDRILTQDAQQRLRAIREFTSLGSGYQIAQRDLEIRGVGNLLGAEQHGHMVAVGFDMYCDMLQESIDELHGKQETIKDDAIIDLNVTAYIPDEWVGDKNVKLTEYKRLGDIRNERGLDIIEAEWKDRFGDIPEETRELMRLVKLRIMATDLGFPTVREDEEHLRIAVPYGLQEWIQLQAKLPDGIGKKARWVPPVRSKEGSLAVLLVKQGVMKGADQVAYLEALFKALLKLRVEQEKAAAKAQ
ncbi:MAG: transcription-repair coupling factor [Vampirovibrionales bacterium]